MPVGGQANRVVEQPLLLRKCQRGRRWSVMGS